MMHIDDTLKGGPTIWSQGMEDSTKDLYLNEESLGLWGFWEQKGSS